MMQTIEWDKFESNFVKIVEGEKKRLVCTGWRQVEKAFGTDAPKAVLVMDVVNQDGIMCTPPKVFEVSAIGLIAKFKPLIMEAEKDGKAFIDVSVTRLGIGKGAKYSVEKN